MAFFEDIGKRITDVSQATIQKAKDTTETMRYSSLIADEEKSIRSLYIQLGELYYKENKDHAAGEYASIVDEINTAHSHIDEYNKKIDEIKNMGKCPKCGAAIASDDIFCASCGTKIERKTVEENVCAKCGKPLNEDAAFCIYCGTKIEAAEVSRAEDIVDEALDEAGAKEDTPG